MLDNISKSKQKRKWEESDLKCSVVGGYIEYVTFGVTEALMDSTLSMKQDKHLTYSAAWAQGGLDLPADLHLK